MIARTLLGLAALVVWSTVAIAYCSEPSAPYCAEQYGEFDDEYDFERCKSELESYQSEVEDYTECVADEARQEIDQAIADQNDAVESFNRRARGW